MDIGYTKYKYRKIIKNACPICLRRYIETFYVKMLSLDTLYHAYILIFLICIPTRCLEENIVIFNKLLKRDVVIPDFKGFCKTVENIYHNCKKNYNGQVACYIPQLARYSPDYWGVSIWYEIINIYLSTFNNWYIFFMARLVCTHT